MEKNLGNRKNLLVLGFTLFVVMLGFGMVIPILPFYIERMGAGGRDLGVLVASYAVMRLIFGPVWGSLSDRLGRKPVLMVGVLGYGITMFLFGLATQFWMMVVIRSLSGILSSATTPTMMAYVGDSTSSRNRSGGMGLLGAALGLGTILGPGLGGLFSGGSLSTPFFIGGGLSLLALLLIALLLPESLPAEARQVTARPGGSVFPLRSMGSALRGPMGILLALTFLVSFGLTSFAGIFGLYAAHQYQYTPQQVGGLLMVMGLVSAVSQGALIGPLTRRWGEPVVIKAALLATALGFVAMALAISNLAILFCMGFFSLAIGLLTPALTALVSRSTGLEQGASMGMNEAFTSLGRIAGPLGSGFLFDLNAVLPYSCGALVMLVSFLVAVRGLAPRDAPFPVPAQ